MILSSVRIALLACSGASFALAGDAPLAVLEPGAATAATPRKPDHAHWSWGQAPAEVVPTGDLKWKPEPFVFTAGKTVRYIDFEHGNDDGDGASKQTAWKHHPWDASAGGKAKEGKGA